MSWLVSADLQQVPLLSDALTQQPPLGFSDKQVQRVVAENPLLFSAALGQGKELSNSVVEVFHLSSPENVRVDSGDHSPLGFVTPGQFPVTGVVASWASTQAPGAEELYVSNGSGSGVSASDSILTVDDLMYQTSAV
jgi:hypothetical protein